METLQHLCNSLNPVLLWATKPCLGHLTPEEQGWKNETDTLEPHCEKFISSWYELRHKTEEHSHLYPGGAWGLHLWHTFFFFSQPGSDAHSYSVSHSKRGRVGSWTELSGETRLSTQTTRCCADSISPGNIGMVAQRVWNNSTQTWFFFPKANLHCMWKAIIAMHAWVVLTIAHICRTGLPA